MCCNLETSLTVTANQKVSMTIGDQNFYDVLVTSKGTINIYSEVTFSQKAKDAAKHPNHWSVLAIRRPNRGKYYWIYAYNMEDKSSVQENVSSVESIKPGKETADLKVS